MSSLYVPTDAWKSSLTKLAASVDGELSRGDGSWRVDFMYSLAGVGQVLANLPVEFRRVFENHADLYDHTGESVEIEEERGLYVCDEARATFDYVDHWQAGLSGSVVVYADEAAYREAVALACDVEGDNPEEYADYEPAS